MPTNPWTRHTIRLEFPGGQSTTRVLTVVIKTRIKHGFHRTKWRCVADTGVGWSTAEWSYLDWLPRVLVADYQSDYFWLGMRRACEALNIRLDRTPHVG